MSGAFRSLNGFEFVVDVFDGGHDFHHVGNVFGVHFAEVIDEGDGVVEVFVEGVGVGPVALVFECLQDVVGCHGISLYVGVVVHQIHPFFREQPGQAFQPDLAKTFSATAICCSLEASHGWSAYSPPPKDSQVE